MTILKHKFLAIRVIYSINIKTYRKMKIFNSGIDGMYKAIFKDKVHIKNASKNRTFWIREQRNMKTHDLGKVTKIWDHPSEKSCSQTTMKVKHRGTREKVQQAKCLQCGAEFRTHVKSQAGYMYPQAQET